MAMHFHDEQFLHCPKCNSPAMTVQNVYRFSADKKEPAVLNGGYLYTEIRCADCGQVAKTVRRAEDIRINK